MGGHGAHDEMQVPGGDRLAVHALEVIECLGAVAALVLTVSFLHFPNVDDVLVLAGGGVEGKTRNGNLCTLRAAPTTS